MGPFVTTVEQVQVRPKTDTLNLMSTVTKDGITNTFNDVQVISKIQPKNLIKMVRTFGLQFRQALIFDRVKEELRIFCANHTIDEVYNVKFLQIVAAVRENLVSSIQRLGDGGLEIMNLVVAKPNIPPDIARNYKQVKVQWTEQLVAVQKQKTKEIEKKTEKLNALADADRDKTVMEITNERRILEKEGDQKVSQLHNEQLRLVGENEANIKAYAIEKEAEANRKLLTAEYVKLNMAKAISPNTKYYFSGEKGIVSGLLSKIMD